MEKIIIQSSTGGKIFINEKEVGIVNRVTKEFEVEKGEHIVYAKANLVWKSKSKG